MLKENNNDRKWINEILVYLLIFWLKNKNNKTVWIIALQLPILPYPIKVSRHKTGIREFRPFPSEFFFNVWSDLFFMKS